MISVKHIPSLCPMDCPDTCSLDIEVSDGRVTNIRGSFENPTTAGFICSKIANFTRRLYAPERLLYPMKRSGPKASGRFERISWQEATDTILMEFKRIVQVYGGEAILPHAYGGSNGLLAQDTSDKAFFAKLGASRLERTICAAPTTAAATGMYGKMPGVAFEDYVHARLIVIWGANPKASNIHLIPFLKKARQNGAKIVIIDPCLNFSKNEFDLHLPAYPGTDLAIALAMIRHFEEFGLLDQQFIPRHTKNSEVVLQAAREYTFEKAAQLAHVSPDDLQKLATWYAESSPAVIRVGWGLERNRNGGNAAAAILALPALMGKFGITGGGYTLSNSSAAKVDDQALVESSPWQTRQINMNLLGKYLLEEKNPPIQALFVYNSNPTATTPNQNAVIKGLMRNDLFTVVFDQVMTDTAQYADILLPAVTFLEQQEVKKSYGSYVLQYCDPVIEPCGEAKPNEEVFAMLGRAWGWTDRAFRETTDDYVARAANAVKGMGYPVNLNELKTKRVLQFDFPTPYPVQFQTVFPRTEDQKVNFAPQSLGKLRYAFIPENKSGTHPFALISPATNKTISSSLGEYNLPELFVSMNPKDARELHLNDLDLVRVYNEYGEVHCKLRVQEKVCEGVLILPKGAWRKASLNGQTATALAPDTLGTAGGACFNDARVAIAALK